MDVHIHGHLEGNKIFNPLKTKRRLFI